MKLGVRWGSRSIKSDARDAAKEAARRAGMSLDDWLNAAIAQSAAQMGVPVTGQAPTQQPAPAAFQPATRQAAPQMAQMAHAGFAAPPQPSALQHRISQITRKGPEAYAPPHLRTSALPHLPKSPALVPAARPMSPQVRWAGDINQAVADIAARQRSLSGGAAQPAPPPAPRATTARMAEPRQSPLPAVPSQDLSGLEEQLRNITAQIETLHRPGVEDAINSLRQELSDIGRAVTDAMPRQAVEAIEAQVQDLGLRIAEGRQAGVDHEALAGLEHGLADIREALHVLTPAENLAGLQDTIHNLAEKIDYIVAQNDPATMQHLEQAVSTLRDVAGHIASNEMVGRLAADVEALAEKVDRIANAAGAGDALANLEHRIAALSDALAERSDAGGHVPPRLEALVDSLSDKIERIQMSRGDGGDTGHLEDRIASLVERLDVSDSRLSHLEAIERGLGDLLVHIEDLRQQRSGGAPAEPVADVSGLKNDMARTKVALDAVHGTLGHVVDRLVAIEHGLRRAPAPQPAHAPIMTPAAPAAPVAPTAQAPAAQFADTEYENEPFELADHQIAAPTVAARAVPLAPLDEAYLAPAAAPVAPPAAMPAPPAPVPHVQQIPPAAQQQAQPRRTLLPQLKRQPINPNLPPDEPLEPGTHAPAASAALRIAESEAALGDAKPKDEKPASGKSFFLAAARRAAKAATRDTSPRIAKAPQPRAADADMEIDADGIALLKPSFATRFKKVLIAASVIAIVVGLVHIAANYYNLGRPDAPATQPAETSGVTPPPPANDTAAPPETTQGIAKPQSMLPGMLPAETPYGIDSRRMGPLAAAGIPTNGLPVQPKDTVSRVPQDNADITGSIARPDQAAPAEKIPAAIGGTKLRTAALAGDPAAAYEVAMRYFEGRGVPANSQDAVRWFERAAAKGLAPAQFRLANLLEKGIGTKKDYVRARALYTAAAEQGNAKAMHNIAVLFAEGVDGRPDYTGAVKWFTRAAEYGVSDSQYNLGILFARGLGVEKNIGEAYKWFAIAAAQGDKEAAKKRDELAGQIDARTSARLGKAATAWAPKQQPDAAINVPAPESGWDEAAPDVAPIKSRSKAAGAYEIGKR